MKNFFIILLLYFSGLAFAEKSKCKLAFKDLHWEKLQEPEFGENTQWGNVSKPEFSENTQWDNLQGKEHGPMVTK